MRVVEYKDNNNIKGDVTPLYVSAFPEDERPPVLYFYKSLKKKENNLLAFYDNDEFIGFTYLTIYKDIVYIFFLAVADNKRDQGYGSKILKYIINSYPDYVKLLCYEDVDKKYEDYKNRCKRERFYQNNGFINNNLVTDEFGVIFQTAYIGNHQVPFEDYVEIFVLGFGERCRKYVKKVR